jgi:hypothetical protein
MAGLFFAERFTKEAWMRWAREKRWQIANRFDLLLGLRQQASIDSCSLRCSEET